MNRDAKPSYSDRIGNSQYADPTDVRPFEVRFDYVGWKSLRATVHQTQNLVELNGDCSWDAEEVFKALQNLLDSLERDAIGVVYLRSNDVGNSQGQESDGAA